MHKITKARKEDTKEIALINKQFHLEIPNFYWNSEKWVSSEIKKGNYYILVEESSILGAIALEKNKKEYEISTIAIKKEMHGKSLGKKLIDFAKEIAIKDKIPLLTVGSFVDYKLEEFYTKCGFTKENKLGNYKGHSYFKFFMKL
jgi:N-acetylglutamate synthase-like GNAT family acetyltransferase